MRIPFPHPVNGVGCGEKMPRVGPAIVTRLGIFESSWQPIFLQKLPKFLVNY